MKQKPDLLKNHKTEKSLGNKQIERRQNHQYEE